MLSLEFIRENAELVKQACADKGDHADVDRLLEVDGQRRKALAAVESLKAERNAGSKQVGKLMQENREEAEQLKERMKGLGVEVKSLERELAPLQEELDSLLLTVPNVPHPDSPAGKGDDDNVELHCWGQKPEFDFEPRPHWDLGEALGILDFKRAVKIAGSGFVCFRGQGARLQRALISYMLDCAREGGYTEVAVPFLVNARAATGTGQLPKLEDEMYRLKADDYFLIPTAEVPVTNLHAGEMLPAAELPIKYCCYSACFRREAGSYGKDTRGMVRVHQFDKVELLKFTTPETSEAEHQALLADAERVLQGLGLHYRVVLVCRGEQSFANAKQYDIEIWAPGMKKFLEVSSVSNFTDFQARRANIRFREGKAKPQFVHTINGSGTALPRLFVALLESCQQSDGSLLLPEALRPYMNGLERIEAE
jgi:seryl-tRNA synthetase